MEPQALITIARDAQINHWPPHLGLNTDAKRVYWLAQQLEESAQIQLDSDDEYEVNTRLEEEIIDLKQEIEELKAKVK